MTLPERRCPDIKLVELVEPQWYEKEPRVIAPNMVYIDGVAYLTEKGSVHILGGNDDEGVRVQMTLFAGSLCVHQALEVGDA